PLHYILSLHDALPISPTSTTATSTIFSSSPTSTAARIAARRTRPDARITAVIAPTINAAGGSVREQAARHSTPTIVASLDASASDRKSTRLNSSHEWT